MGNGIRWFHIRYSGYLSQPWISYVPSMSLERVVENDCNYPTPQAPRYLRVVSERILGLSWCHRRACTTRVWICLVLIISTVETSQDKCCFSIIAKYYNVEGATIRAAAECFAVKSTSSKGFSYENVIEPFFSCHQFSSSTWHDREISLSHIL